MLALGPTGLVSFVSTLVQSYSIRKGATIKGRVAWCLPESPRSRACVAFRTARAEWWTQAQCCGTIYITHYVSPAKKC